MESTKLAEGTKDALYEQMDRTDSYNDAVERLLALRQAVEQHPDVSVDGLMQMDERDREQPNCA
jgi:hypothetical protein